MKGRVINYRHSLYSCNLEGDVKTRNSKNYLTVGEFGSLKSIVVIFEFSGKAINAR